MSDLSARLGLPYLMPAQAQKHVTHNEALTLLDLLVQLNVQGFGAETPPAMPLSGQVWALGPAPSGAWVGQGGQLAFWNDDTWLFVPPQTGWHAAAVTAQGAELRLFDGADWVAAAAGMPDTLPGLGVNAAFDATNRLAVASDAVLLTHDGAGHQLKINKATVADTASLLFQTGWSGRAEMGTAGNDDFSIKVSADELTWHDGLVINRMSGKVSAPNGLDAHTVTLDGSQVYAHETILGAVSQSGGVPTGAIIQRGSNANGSFARFADGTQICWHGFSSSTSAGVTWTYPAAFSGVVRVSLTPNSTSEARVATFSGRTETSVLVHLFAPDNTRLSHFVEMTAIGSWY